jgi:tetratricopeptide (TPR) repeat protein
VWNRTLGFILGLFLVLLISVPNFSYGENISKITWQLIVISSAPACSTYHYYMVEKFTEITQKYLDLYKLEHTSYQPACMTSGQYYTKYEKPRDLDLIVLVYDRGMGETELHIHSTGGIYMHQGEDLSTNHTVVICDCPNYYYSDPVWILSHELSHFVLNYLGFDLDVVEQEIHKMDKKYDHCVEVSYDDSCSLIKTKIEGQRHNWTVMTPYKPAIGKNFSQNIKRVSLDSPFQTTMIKEITKWWLTNQISNENYVKSLQILSGKKDGNNLSAVGILSESPIVFLSEPQIEKKQTHANEEFSSALKENMIKTSPFSVPIETSMSAEDYKIFLDWLKTKADSWDSGELDDKNFIIELEYILNSPKPDLYIIYLDNLSVNELMNKGLEYEKNGQYMNALSFFDRALLETIKSNESMVDILSKKGSVLNSLGMYEKALIYFDNALEEEPENIEILKQKAFSLAQIGKLDDAKYYFEMAYNLEN